MLAMQCKIMYLWLCWHDLAQYVEGSWLNDRLLFGHCVVPCGLFWHALRTVVTLTWCQLWHAHVCRVHSVKNVSTACKGEASDVRAET